MIGWTDEFDEFRKKVESCFGPLELLAKEAPDLYTHQVLAHGFMEYALAKSLIGKDGGSLREEYFNWARKNKLCENLLEEGWKEYLED